LKARKPVSLVAPISYLFSTRLLPKTSPASLPPPPSPLKKKEAMKKAWGRGEEGCGVEEEDINCGCYDND